MAIEIDNLHNPDHIGHIPSHRKQELTLAETVVRHACYHARHAAKYAVHLCVITFVGLPSIGAWEMIIKPIMEAYHTLPG